MTTRPAAAATADWSAATEFYPRQLREVERVAYLDKKRMEYLRQQAGPA
jgi:hypothetical protein